MSIERLDGMEYLKPPAISMIQSNVQFFLLSMSVHDLLKVCAFRPAEYNAVEDKFIELSLLEDKINPLELLKDNSESDFNRKLDNKKLKSILEYAESSEKAMFPNSLILAAHWKPDSFLGEIEGSPEGFDSKIMEEFNSVNGVYFDCFKRELYIPIIEQSILIVDGQHRLAGLSDLSLEQQKKLELPITLVVGESNAVLSNMFYTINSTQKPVNSSVLEYMTNLFLTDFSEAKLLQEYIRVLNDNKNSPLYQQVKMFGVGHGIVSFATLHENLMIMTLQASNRSKKIPILRFLFENDELQYFILNVVVYYFNSLRSIFSIHTGDRVSWNTDIVFTKTIGIVALLQLLPRLILKIIDSKYDLNDPKSLTLIKQEDFEGIVSNLLKIETSKYDKGASMGVSKTLRDEMVSVLDLEHYDDSLAKRISWLERYYK